MATAKLDMENLLDGKPSRQRSLILALIVQRLLFPCSKLASLHYWHSTTLAEELEDFQVGEVWGQLGGHGYRRQIRVLGRRGLRSVRRFRVGPAERALHQALRAQCFRQVTRQSRSADRTLAGRRHR